MEALSAVNILIDRAPVKKNGVVLHRSRLRGGTDEESDGAAVHGDAVSDSVPVRSFGAIGVSGDISG